MLAGRNKIYRLTVIGLSVKPRFSRSYAALCVCGGPVAINVPPSRLVDEKSKIRSRPSLYSLFIPPQAHIFSSLSLFFISF